MAYYINYFDTDSHICHTQRLKKFLHPKCNICSKEFYTRLEWDDHKLTPAHLKVSANFDEENAKSNIKNL